MRRLSTLAFSAFLFLPAIAGAQALEVPAPSPKASVSQRVGLTDFSVEYSSPGVKGRKIWGDLVPYDKVWRTGANAATKLTASKDFTIGDKQVKAGTYSLHTIPGKAAWTVILNSNKDANTGNYDEKLDVARVSVKPTALPAVRERLAFLFSDTTEDGVNLDLEWEKTRVRVPLKVDTKGQMQAAIEKATGDAWRPHYTAAGYLLGSGGDLDRAMGYADRSIAIQPTWWNHWVKGQILAKKGKKAEALASFKQAQELGKGDEAFESFGKGELQKSIDGVK
jgi:hypothetical protein